MVHAISWIQDRRRRWAEICQKQSVSQAGPFDEQAKHCSAFRERTSHSVLAHPPLPATRTRDITVHLRETNPEYHDMVRHVLKPTMCTLLLCTMGHAMFVEPSHAFSPLSRKIRADSDAVPQDLDATQYRVLLLHSRLDALLDTRNQ